MALELIPLKNVEQDFSVTGPKAGQLVSTTHIDCELVIPATQEVFTLPLQVCTKVEDLKNALLHLQALAKL